MKKDQSDQFSLLGVKWSFHKKLEEKVVIKIDGLKVGLSTLPSHVHAEPPSRSRLVQIVCISLQPGHQKDTPVPYKVFTDLNFWLIFAIIMSQLYKLIYQVSHYLYKNIRLDYFRVFKYDRDPAF